LAVPTGTFTDRSVFETIDLLHELNIHHLELSPGQPLEPGKSIPAGHTMPADAVAALMAKLKSVHMDIVSFGPIDLGPDDASARAVFVFAKLIKAKDVVASPPADALERLDKLAAEYGVNLAIANEAASSIYRSPADVQAAVASRSSHIGSDDDLVQWQHAAADPLAATQLLHDHITQTRVGDLDAQALQAVLAELKSQKFKGVITIACPRGSGMDEVNRFATSVSELSDAVTKVAAN
jgi:sugar phosphate isomerase/epimerase